MQRHLFRQRKNILLGISMGIFMISVLGGTQNVKGLGATTDSAPQYEDLPSSACEVQNGENIQWFLDDPNCNIITVQPGKYKQRWLNAHRDNVTLKCAVLGACELASIEVFGNHNVVDGFVITSKEYKTGLRTMGNDNLITNNEIYHMKEDGMWLWGKNNVIRGNYIHDIYHPDLPQYPGYDEHVDCFMTFSWSWPIDNMVIEDNLCVLDRQNGSNQFYILTHSGSAPFKNITIRNNVFIAKDSGYVPVAFFGDSTVTGVRIINNTFYNVSGQGANPVYLDHMPNTYVANNVSIGYTGDIVRNINSSALVENNITRPPYGMQNVQGYDFHLLTGSPLIDSGVPSGIAYDFDGNPRDERPDIGAFEYVTNTPPTEMPSPTITVMPTGGNAPSPLPGLNWEAEHGEITAPFAVLNGIVSQNVLTSNPADGGRALYRFTILEAGNYNIKAVVNAADANSNSFFVNMDTEPDISMIWDVPMTNGFEERFVSWREDIGPNGIASNAKVFSLSSGEHTLIIRGRESTVLLDSLEVVGASMSAEPTSTVPLPPTETQTPFPTATPMQPTMTETPPTHIGNAPSLPGLSWEAEQGEITAPFSAINGVVSQNILTGNPADGGRALYRFTIQDGGDYAVRAVVNAADEGRNSFFVGMDTEPDASMIWDVPLTNGFEERTVTWRDGSAPDANNISAKVFSLSAGEHTLIIRGREISTLLDKIEVSRVSPVYPTATANPTASLMPTQIPALTATPITETLIPTPPPVPPTAIPTESLAPESPTPTETSVPPTPVPPTVIPPTAGPTSQPSVDTVYDDKDSAFVYSGWYNVGKVQAYGGSYKQTTEYSSVATLNFTGQSFSILYKSGPKYGMLHVFIDGTMMGFIDQNERPQAYQRRWDFPGQLSSGPHTLTLVFVSPDMKASLDAVIVR